MFFSLEMSLLLFNQLEQKLAGGEIVSFTINFDLQPLAEIGNTIISLIDRNGNSYNSEVVYDPVQNKIFPPFGIVPYSNLGQLLNRMIQRAREQLDQPMKYYRLEYYTNNSVYYDVDLYHLVFSGHSQEEVLLKIRQYIFDHASKPIDIINNNDIETMMKQQHATVDEVIDAIIYNFVDNDALTLSEVILI